jgi:purine nucleosidase
MSEKKVIIDSDAKNEIDDQYAITYAVLSEELDLRGFTAAHFGRKGSMEKSYEEILLLLRLLGKENKYSVLQGAGHALGDERTPVDSPAARFIVEEAFKHSGEPLYVVSIGAITNLASAYLIEPGIRERIKVFWIAGKKWPEGGFCFNDKNDISAARIIFDSDIDLTLIPVCRPASRLKIYMNDRPRLKGKGEIGDYLWKLFMRRRFGFPKPVYDVAAVAVLKSPGWCTAETAPRPELLKNGKYEFSKTSGMLTVVTDINAEEIRSDFFRLLDEL